MGRSQDFILKASISLAIQAIPWYIALIAWVFRYFGIYRDGINLKTKYSRLTKSKLYLCYGMALFYTLPIPFSLSVESYWLKRAQNGTKWAVSFGYLIFTVTWLFLGLLLQMEHSRNLNNEVYWHKLFWVLNCGFILIWSTVVIILEKFDNDWVDYSFMIFSFAGSMIAVGMMFMTRPKKRVRVPDRNSVLNEIEDPETVKSYKEQPIKISMDYSFNYAEIMKFKIKTEKMSRTVERKFTEFLDIENYLLEYIQKQAPGKVSEVPTLDKSRLRTDNSITITVEKKFK